MLYKDPGMLGAVNQSEISFDAILNILGPLS